MLSKKMLCINYLKRNKCPYDNKCIYAHNTNEQIIDPVRKKVYHIIQNEFDLSYLNIIKHKELIQLLILFTKYCNDCINNNCIGGCNCKNGIYKKELQLCFNYLFYGNCTTHDCKKIHLTKRKFNPIKKKRHYLKFQDIPQPIELKYEFFNSSYYNELLDKL
jgi:hypothetical protein